MHPSPDPTQSPVGMARSLAPAVSLVIRSHPVVPDKSKGVYYRNGEHPVARAPGTPTDAALATATYAPTSAVACFLIRFSSRALLAACFLAASVFSFCSEIVFHCLHPAKSMRACIQPHSITLRSSQTKLTGYVVSMLAPVRNWRSGVAKGKRHG